jgi:hypothetical protein
MAIAALIGMAADYYSTGAKSLGSANQSAYSLPPTSPAKAGGAAAGSTMTTLAGGAASATTKTTAGASGSTGTTTTLAGAASTGTSSTTTTAAPAAGTGPAQLLLPAYQSKGNWTSTTFTTTSPGWNIGWAFQCTPAPASGPSFQVFVTTPGGSATGTPAVNETGASGQSASSQSSLGGQILIVQAPSNCEWVVKVTGN